MDKHFEKFRKNIIGIDSSFSSPCGEKKIIYADWIASGRLYRPIENFISEKIGPYVANTHTETTFTGKYITLMYHQAQNIIKKHVNADGNDVLVMSGAGMTSVINKMQRILGIRVPERLCNCEQCETIDKPLVIITHMEHHSNHTTWNECCCDVEIIRRASDGLPDLENLKEILENNRERKLIIGSFSACSNVTGLVTPYYQMAEIVHQFNGYCFVDFAASAPYVKIDMHPVNPKQRLDAVFFSPHKFLGGPGSSGVMVFNKEIYNLETPDQPGGGTVLWTNPWGEQKYYNDIEVREDGGTPGFLQGIKAALAISLKEEMCVENILEREAALKNLLIEKLIENQSITILEGDKKDRIGIVSFYSLHRHHNLIVKLLNDRFGIQTRGGCSCAGTYGHILMNVDREMSKHITEKINHGDLSEKPGWVRISVHPAMTEEEIIFIAESVHEVLRNYDSWAVDYSFDNSNAEFHHKSEKDSDLSNNSSNLELSYKKYSVHYNS